jgi:hypothetical protein
MLNAISDFMIHVDESLDKQAREAVEDHVRAHACVISAAIPPQTPHLMLVVYDSDCSSAGQILGHVRDRGLHSTML